MPLSWLAQSNRARARSMWRYLSCWNIPASSMPKRMPAFWDSSQAYSMAASAASAGLVRSPQVTVRPHRRLRPSTTVHAPHKCRSRGTLRRKPKVIRHSPRLESQVPSWAHRTRVAWKRRSARFSSNSTTFFRALCSPPVQHGIAAGQSFAEFGGRCLFSRPFVAGPPHVGLDSRLPTPGVALTGIQISTSYFTHGNERGGNQWAR